VNVIVLAVEPFPTAVVAVVSVPEPSAAETLIEGLDARFVSVPATVDCACACHVAAPPVVEAVAVSAATQEPPVVAPYVIVTVTPTASVSPDTVIVRPWTLVVPAEDVTQPTALLVVGAVHPDGTVTDTAPPEIPPVGAV
jgi:hypothetical protein